LGILTFFLLSPHPILAEETFVATLDRDEISLEESAVLVLSLKTGSGNEEVSLPVVPQVPGLFIFYHKTRQVLSPQAGKVSPAKEFVYTLSPETLGTKTIPPIGIHVNSRLLLTKALTLKVVSKISEPSQNRIPSNISKQLSDNETSLFSDQSSSQMPKAFARIVVDNPRPYLYEPVKVTLWAYATVPFQYQGLKEEPDHPGFTQLKELTGEFVSQEITEIREGETYSGRSVTEEVWFPHQSGTLFLKLGELTLSLKTEAKNLFDRSFQEERPAGHFRSHAEPVVLKVEPVSFEVQPLPEENRPEDFSGAVGDFTVLTSVDKTELEVGESATLKFQILGKGNLKQMKELSFEKFPFATSFQPRPSDRIKREKLSVSSEKTYEVILITNREGSYTINPFSFSYFSPKFRGYRKATTQPIPIVIHEKAKSAFAAPLEHEKVEPELLGKDIYYLKKELGPLHPKGSSLLNSRFFWGLQGVPLLILGLSLLWRSYQLYLLRNEVIIRRRKAFQVSQGHFKKAEHYLAEGHIEDFAREAQEAILGYLSDKTGTPLGALTLDKIELFVRDAGGDETVLKNLRECLESYQAIQFASSQPFVQDPRGVFDLSKGVLRQLEKIPLSSFSKES